MKLKHLGIAAAIAASLVLVGCNSNNNADSSATVATVNGDAIHADTLDTLLDAMANGQTIKKPLRAKRSLLNRLVQLKVLAQTAQEQGLADKPSIKAQLEVQKEALLAKALVRQHVKDNPVTDDDVEAAFQKQLKTMDQNEYKARHILLKTKEDADNVIAKLDNGANFATLAKAKSTGPTAKKGGELGWFTPSDMVPPFAKAVQNLKKGHYTEDPVQTRFGWHVILLQDTRATPKPKLEKIKSSLQRQLAAKKNKDFIKSVRDQAQVSINEDYFKPKQATPTPASSSPAQTATTPTPASATQPQQTAGE